MFNKALSHALIAVLLLQTVGCVLESEPNVAGTSQEDVPNPPWAYHQQGDAAFALFKECGYALSLKNLPRTIPTFIRQHYASISLDEIRHREIYQSANFEELGIPFPSCGDDVKVMALFQDASPTRRLDLADSGFGITATLAPSGSSLFSNQAVLLAGALVLGVGSIVLVVGWNQRRKQLTTFSNPAIKNHFEFQSYKSLVVSAAVLEGLSVIEVDGQEIPGLDKDWSRETVRALQRKYTIIGNAAVEIANVCKGAATADFLMALYYEAHAANHQNADYRKDFTMGANRMGTTVDSYILLFIVQHLVPLLVWGVLHKTSWTGGDEIPFNVFDCRLINPLLRWLLDIILKLEELALRAS